MPLNYCSLGFAEEANKMLQDAEQAITKSDTWEWMKGDPAPWGYYMSPAPEMKEIRKHINYEHTGITFGIAMKEMQKLAILGIDEYCSSRTQPIAAARAAPKTGPVRSKEMDEKVIHEYKTRPPFASLPKWCRDYITVFPDVLRGLSMDDYKSPALSNPGVYRLKY